MIKKLTPFEFVDGVVSYDTSEVFCVRVDPGIAVTSELLKALYYLLWFPGYFGFNWNALYDCLRDLEWIPMKRVAVIHGVLPNIPDADLKIYLEILRDSIVELKANNRTNLEIVFPESARERVERLLNDKLARSLGTLGTDHA